MPAAPRACRDGLAKRRFRSQERLIEEQGGASVFLLRCLERSGAQVYPDTYPRGPCILPVGGAHVMDRKAVPPFTSKPRRGHHNPTTCLNP